MARADLIVLVVGVAAIVTVIVAGALRQGPQVPETPDTDCPELEPVPQIAPERAVVVMAASYIHIELWDYYPRAMVKWCQVTGEWWVSLNMNGSTYLCTAGERDVTCSVFLGSGKNSFGPWSRHPGEIPSVLASYAWNAETDVVLFLVSASFLRGIPAVEDGWVDAETSLLVAKERVAE
ncbi:MAG: hypothetical protein ACE5I4_06130 [Thermoplasmata archaeon]